MRHRAGHPAIRGRSNDRRNQAANRCRKRKAGEPMRRQARRMTGAEIMTVVGFFVMLFGFLSGVWWRIEGKVKEGRDEAATKADAAVNLAALARADLADYKHEVAVTYATKAGMQEQTTQLLRAIESIGGRIDHIGERIDNIILHQQKPAPRSRS